MIGSFVLARMSSGRRGSRFMKGTCAAEKASLLLICNCRAAQLLEIQLCKQV